jgi:dihydrodipicolinate synthase/N-acetylneuraminate lyase
VGQLLKGGARALKAASRVMGRDCGDPRPPLIAANSSASTAIEAELPKILRDEPRGW